MRVSSPDGTDTEAIGPALADLHGEVWVLHGRLLPVSEFRRCYTPQPERRRVERRQRDRRRNRREGRRHMKRRLRDHVSEAEAWARVVRVYREEGV